MYPGTRPAFAAFVVLQVASGYAVGILESVLNAYLSALPIATTAVGGMFTARIAWLYGALTSSGYGLGW